MVGNFQGPEAAIAGEIPMRARGTCHFKIHAPRALAIGEAPWSPAAAPVAAGRACALSDSR
eukprot:1909240-Pyramimonas_sp.AAC.1